MNKQELVVLLGGAVGVLLVIAVFGGLFALLVNFVLSYIFVSWPVTWGNWGVTWLALGLIGYITGKGVKK